MAYLLHPNKPFANEELYPETILFQIYTEIRINSFELTQQSSINKQVKEKSKMCLPALPRFNNMRKKFNKKKEKFDFLIVSLRLEYVSN